MTGGNFLERVRFWTESKLKFRFGLKARLSFGVSENPTDASTSEVFVVDAQENPNLWLG